MAIFKYTDHVMLWTLMSSQGQVLIDMIRKLDNVNKALFRVTRGILNYMGYDEDTYPEFNSFIIDYALQTDRAVFPVRVYEEDENGISLYDNFKLAIKEQDTEKIKQACLAIARAELKEDIMWK